MSRRTKKKRTRQRGGAINPILVDFKKGFQVTKDMIAAVKKPVNKQKARREVAGYKREYQAYKRGGGSKSFNSWVLSKGYGKRNPGCCIL